MVKKLAWLSLVSLAAVSLTGPAQSQPGGPLDPYQECGVQCTWFGSNVWCSEISFRANCCYDSGDPMHSGACGEVDPCDACGGREGGGF